jgi:hypothetical protein
MGWGGTRHAVDVPPSIGHPLHASTGVALQVTLSLPPSAPASAPLQTYFPPLHAVEHVEPRAGDSVAHPPHPLSAVGALHVTVLVLPAAHTYVPVQPSPALHAVPGTGAVAGSGTQPPSAAQQPSAHDAVVHVHVPAVGSHACPIEHAPHAAPAAPQTMGDWLAWTTQAPASSQHPALHEAAVHTHVPVESHACPGAQAPQAIPGLPHVPAVITETHAPASVQHPVVQEGPHAQPASVHV